MTIAQCIHWLGGDWVALTCFWTSAKQHLVTQHSATPNPFTWRHTIKQKTGCCIFFPKECLMPDLHPSPFLQNSHWDSASLQESPIPRWHHYREPRPWNVKATANYNRIHQLQMNDGFSKKKKVRCCVGGAVRRETDFRRVSPSSRAEKSGECSKHQL